MSAENRMADSSQSRIDVKALYEQYGRAVYRRCQYYLRNDADATDAMHDVFLKVVERHTAFRGQSSPLTWVVRIATNHCLNIIRARKAAWHDRYEKTVKAGNEQRQGDHAQLERRELVRTLLRKVDRKTQEAAVYYFVDEMTQEEAAKAADCSVPTLRKRLRAFIKTARKELKQIDTDLVFGKSPI